MDKDFLDAKRLYLERYGSAIVTNRWLLLLLLISLFLNGTSYVFIWKADHAAQNQKKLIVRIDEIGSATAVKYDAFDYKPQDKELRFFLMHFTTIYFSRTPATVEKQNSLKRCFSSSAALPPKKSTASASRNRSSSFCGTATRILTSR